MHTPRFCGEPLSLLPLFLRELNEYLKAGALSLRRFERLPFRTS